MTKIHQANSALYVEYIAGLSVMKKKGKLGALDTWINPESTANIISITIPASHITLKKSGLSTPKKGKYKLQVILCRMQRDALCGTEEDRVWSSGH